MIALHRFAAIAATGVLVSVSAVAPALGREWTSKAGTTINAQLVRVHLDNVILKKDDGRELVVPVAKLSASDQEYLRLHAAAKTGAEAAQGELLEELTGRLAKVESGRVKRAMLGDAAGLKYIAVYYSAHWCGPCRAFTPELVEFYERLKPDHPEFEVIFVSADRSEKEWETYMIEEGMSWHAVPFGRVKDSRLKAFGGPGIPCLVVLTPAGEVLSDSYVDGNYVGPRKVLKDLEHMLSAGEPVAPASPADPASPSLETLGSLEPGAGLQGTSKE